MIIKICEEAEQEFETENELRDFHNLKQKRIISPNTFICLCTAPLKAQKDIVPLGVVGQHNRDTTISEAGVEIA